MAGHDPGSAVLYLSRAVQSCPVNHGDDLTRLLYYLGIALKRLGYSNSAIRSWVASQKMRRRKHTRELLDRFANGYGMAKQDCQDQDDWQAFYSIQLTRYLRGFNKRTLTSRCERSMLHDIIQESWNQLKASGRLEGKSVAQKSALFKSTTIDFPLFYLSRLTDPVLRVNFQTGRKLREADACPCGSGLCYVACCGRTPGEDELAIGPF